MPFKALIPSFPSPKRVRSQIVTSFSREARAQRQKLVDIVDKFDSPDKPEFLSQVKFGRGGFTVSVFADDSPAGQRFTFLDQGTRERFAVMSDDFEAKTSPGGTSVGRGRGQRQIILPEGSDPLPGIEAREFTTTIQENNNPDFVAKVGKSLTKNVWDRIFTSKEE